MATDNFDATVFIAGGGLLGLSTAMFLAQHGVAATGIDRLRGVSALPRAAHWLELFRSAGIEDEVCAQSEREFISRIPSRVPVSGFEVSPTVLTARKPA